MSHRSLVDLGRFRSDSPTKIDNSVMRLGSRGCLTIDHNRLTLLTPAGTGLDLTAVGRV